MTHVSHKWFPTTISLYEDRLWSNRIPTDTQTYRQTTRYTDRQTYRQTDRQTDGTYIWTEPPTAQSKSTCRALPRSGTRPVARQTKTPGRGCVIKGIFADFANKNKTKSIVYETKAFCANWWPSIEGGGDTHYSITTYNLLYVHITYYIHIHIPFLFCLVNK